MGISDSNVRVTFRLPEELHEKLMRIARENERSLNSQMIHMLKKACLEEQAQDKK